MCSLDQESLLNAYIHVCIYAWVAYMLYAYINTGSTKRRDGAERGRGTSLQQPAGKSWVTAGPPFNRMLRSVYYPSATVPIGQAHIIGTMRDPIVLCAYLDKLQVHWYEAVAVDLEADGTDENPSFLYQLGEHDGTRPHSSNMHRGVQLHVDDHFRCLVASPLLVRHVLAGELVGVEHNTTFLAGFGLDGQKVVPGAMHENGIWPAIRAHIPEQKAFS